MDRDYIETNTPVVVGQKLFNDNCVGANPSNTDEVQHTKDYLEYLFSDDIVYIED